MIPKGSRCSAFTAILAAGWIFAGWSRRPGIGLSDPVEPRSLTDFGGDIEELMERLRLKRPVVMGVSGGGPYVLACLSRLGKKIRAGVVVCGLGPMDTEDSAKG